MARTWKNHPCTFQTINTLNTLGNSTYTVTEDTIHRYAPINQGRSPREVDNRPLSRAICYIQSDGKLLTLVMHETDDSNIVIDSVKGDDIWVRVRTKAVTDGQLEYFGMASRLPKAGYTTFDFTNNNGVLSGVHVGHQVEGGSLK